MRIFRYLTSITVIMVLLAGCASQGHVSSEERKTDSSVELEIIDKYSSHLTLADKLKRVSGVSVRGQGSSVQIMIRGASTISGDNTPLFVIDGSPIGNSYAQAENSVDINDIANIRVLRGSDASHRYGLRGSNGVIEIFTK